MIRIKALYIYLFSLCLLAFSPVATAQYSSEEELKNAANTFFNEENFIEALPLFSQLLSTYPKDVNYNYKYGAAYLYATRDKEKAIGFLSFAVSRANVEPLAFYYMAKAYHHNYDFASAIVYYNKYKAKSTAKEHQKYQLDRQVAMCENGQKLLKKINKIGVIDKKEIKETEFFRSYDLRGISGKVIVKPDDFQSKADKKNNDRSILFSDPNQNTIVYSSYGDKGTNKDIYKIEKIGVGQFSEPVSLGSVINTEFDEDFAFLHPDGKTLYFSSKGHNSMGGYDIFKTTYNAAAGTWSAPVNLDFPINTPDDDVLYISDIDNQLAYFASSRASKQDELTVYRVKVEPEPVQNPMIKGVFLAEQNPDMKDATISIMDANTNVKLGVYKSDSKTGEYLLTFPKAATKYKLIVETTSDAPIHSAIIEVPAQKDFALMKQQLLLVGQGESEKLVVKNRFDEADEFDITNPIIVQNLLKQRAKLDVNITEEEALNSLNTTAGNEISSTNQPESSEFENLSDEKLVTVVKEKISTLIEKTKTSKEQADFFYNLANKKTAAAKKTYATNENKLEVANNVNEGVVALNLARVVESEANERGLERKNLDTYNNQIANLIQNGKRAEAEELLANVNKIEAAGYFANSAVEEEKRIKTEKLKEKQQAANKQRDVVIELTNGKLELEKSISDLETKLTAKKKAKEKEEIQAQLDTYKIDLEDSDFQLEKAKQKEAVLKKEYLAAKNELQLFEQVLAAKEKSSKPTTTLDANQKLALERNITFFEEEGVVGLYPTDEALAVNDKTTSNLDDLSALKDAFEIIDNEGNLIDYNANYATQLANAEVETNALKRAENTAKINENWIKAIDDDIQIKNYQLDKTTDLNAKVQLKQIVDKLNDLKQQKEIERAEQLAVVSSQSGNSQSSVDNSQSSTSNTQSREVGTGVPTSNSEIADNSSQSSTSNPEQSGKATQLPSSNIEITDADGNIIDYNSSYLTALENLPADEQSTKIFAQKAQIYNNWANTTEQEITFRKNELTSANADEKNAINDKIEELQIELQDKQEFAALFFAQAKALATTDEELAYIDELQSNSSQSTVGSSQSSTSSTQPPTSNLETADNSAQSNSNQSYVDNSQSSTSNPEQSGQATQLPTSNLQPQTSNTASSNPEIETLKTEVAALKKESETLYTEADTEKNNAIKNEKIAEADAIVEKTIEKELQLAAIYEKVNNTEFNKNKSVLNQLISTYGENSTDNNFIMGEMLSEEATELFNQANLIREKAKSETDKSTKNELNEEAFNIELQAIQKQQNAILLIDKNNLVATNRLSDNSSQASVGSSQANGSQSNSSQSSTSNSQPQTSNTEITDSDGNIIDYNSSYLAALENLPAEEQSSQLFAQKAEIYSNWANAIAQEIKLKTTALINANADEKEAKNDEIEALEVELQDKQEFAALFLAQAKAAATTDEELAYIDDLQSSVGSSQSNSSQASVGSPQSSTSNLKPQTSNSSQSSVDSPQSSTSNLKPQTSNTEIADNSTQSNSSQSSTSNTQLPTSSNSQPSTSSLQPQTSNTASSNTQPQTSNLKPQTSTPQTNREATVYEPVSISLASDEVVANADRIMKEAEILNLEAETITDSAETIKNKKEKQTLIAQATEKKEEANRKTNEAEVLYAEANELKSEENELKTALADIRNAIVMENLTNDDEAIFNQLNPDEVVELKNKEEYVEYKVLKQESRRLIKEAQVEYVEADKAKQEAQDQVGLGSALKAMEQAASSEEDKTKLQSQLQKLEQMIAENEEKAKNLRAAATEKEKKALENNKKTTELLADNDASTQRKIEAIEKIEHFNGDELAVVGSQSNSSQSSNLNPQTSNTQNATSNSEIVDDSSQSNSSQSSVGSSQNSNLNPQTSNTQNSTSNSEIVDNSSQSSTSNTQLPTSNITQPQTSTPATEIPEKLTTSIFSLTPINQSSYSNNKPIPKNVKLPEGLVFKVQIGAFRNPIPQDLFKGFNPIMAEDAGGGLTRYTAGLFNAFNAANEAKNEVRTMGYPDAFVVAYLNGKRININEARAMLNDTENSTQSNSSQSSVGSSQSSTSSIQLPTSNTQPANNTINTEEVKDGISKDVRNIDGVFYTVQVGVYSKEITAGELNNLTPINSDRITGGLIRYTSGIYKNVNEANNAKDRIRNLGISDAFVIAYQNGVKIPVAQANALLGNISQSNSSQSNSSQSSIESPQSSASNLQPQNSNTQSTSQNTQTNNDTFDRTITDEELQQKAKDLAILFKVKIGEYEDEVPNEDAAMFLKLSERGVESIEEGTKTIYTVGSFLDYKSALNLQLEVAAMGIKNATVIALQNDIIIPTETALELIKNN